MLIIISKRVYSSINPFAVNTSFSINPFYSFGVLAQHLACLMDVLQTGTYKVLCKKYFSRYLAAIGWINCVHVCFVLSLHKNVLFPVEWYKNNNIHKIGPIFLLDSKLNVQFHKPLVPQTNYL